MLGADESTGGQPDPALKKSMCLLRKSHYETGWEMQPGGQSSVLGSPAEATDAHWAGGWEVESGDVPQGDDP